MLGNFAADFINNKEVDLLDKSLLMGVHLHRRIDTFTDKHPVVKRSTKRLHAYHHKYSPVLVDIFYDYFLAKNWHKYSNIPIQGFIEDIYEVVLSNMHYFPEKLQNRLPNMVQHNWLKGYTHFDGLEIVFDKISQITHFPGNFENATEHLALFENEFENDFLVFFPELVEDIERYFVENGLTFEVKR
jgi:acyl carrier protein phosphodiesterase